MSFAVAARFVPVAEDTLLEGAFSVWLGFTGASFKKADREGQAGVEITNERGTVFAAPGDLVAFDPKGKVDVYRLAAVD